MKIDKKIKEIRKFFPVLSVKAHFPFWKTVTLYRGKKSLDVSVAPNAVLLKGARVDLEKLSKNFNNMVDLVEISNKAINKIDRELINTIIITVGVYNV